MSGKLQFVKRLLEKLQSLLTSDGNADYDNSRVVDTSKINTFLDTPLSEFITEQVGSKMTLVSDFPKGRQCCFSGKHTKFPTDAE
jgi:hypothetical protein